MPPADTPPPPPPSAAPPLPPPPVAPPPMPRTSWWLLGLLAVSILAAAAMLYFFNPQEHRFYPKCMLYQTTGIQCPGCGGLRAGHALLHGKISEALKLNPLLVVLAPLLLYILAREIAQACFNRVWPFPFRQRWALWAFLGLLLVYSIARNWHLLFGGQP